MTSLRALASVAAALPLTASVLAGTVQFRSATDIVEVHATVKLKNGTIAHDLTRADFELFEDGKPREITVFSESVQPLSVALVLDHSGSTHENFSDVRLAAQEFVGRLLRTDRASIGTLTWDCQPFTNSPQSLLAVLRRQLPTDWGSPVWAATDRAMTSLASESGRRVILLLSDGEDTQRAAQLGGPPFATPGLGFGNPCEYAPPREYRNNNDVTKRAERDGIMVYTVSVGASDSGSLFNVAKQSGAAHQRLREYSELRAAFKSIADELHLQYLLGFVPGFDGKRHTIEVRVKRPGVTVQARRAYVAAKSSK